MRTGYAMPEGTPPVRRAAALAAALAGWAAVACAAVPAARATCPTDPRGASIPGVCARLSATVETADEATTGDSADDEAIWIDPVDPAQSLVLGTNKNASKVDPTASGMHGSLSLYRVTDGSLVQRISPDGPDVVPNPDSATGESLAGRYNNVDVRYNFPLAGQPVSLVAVDNKGSLTGTTADSVVQFFRLDPGTHRLVFINQYHLGTSPDVARGLCLYHSPVSGRYYLFVEGRNSRMIFEYELDGSSGKVVPRLVRSFLNGAGIGPGGGNVGNNAEGMVADDEQGQLYGAVEGTDGGIFRYGAEPGDSDAATTIDRVLTAGGHIPNDVKGLALYYGKRGTGYVLAISQGGNSTHVYDRAGGAWVGEFQVAATPSLSIDSVTGMDGIDATSFQAGPSFPQGFVSIQDDVDSPPGTDKVSANNLTTDVQNHKFVPWPPLSSAFAATFGNPLLIDTSVDPRLVGAPGADPFGHGASPTPGLTPPPGAVTPGSTTGTTPGSATKAPAGLTIVSARLRHGRLKVRGRVAAGATGRVQLSFSGRRGHRAVRGGARATISHGAFAATLRVKGAVAAVRRGKLTVRYAGDAAHRGQTVVRAVRG